ncbi:hypothetical protein LP420_27490 [Massilia sp. B-10]|nr:hypothetical protein LP420_27490 [Massilia sp. B-10]
MMVFDPVTLPADGDLYALLATFLQLHHVEHVDDIGSGTYLSSGVHLIRPYEFVGFYLCLSRVTLMRAFSRTWVTFASFGSSQSSTANLNFWSNMVQVLSSNALKIWIPILPGLTGTPSIA